MGGYQKLTENCKQLKAEQVVLRTQNANLAVRLQFSIENRLQQREQLLDANIQGYVANSRGKIS